MTAPTTAHRFSTLSVAPPDAILGLTEAYLGDTNPDKMNLSVGVYKDASGQTPVLRCVKAAEAKLIESEKTKGYLPIDGYADYRDHVRNLVFDETIAHDRIAVIQSPGGTGALRVAADFLVTQVSPIQIWTPTPTWANHGAIFASAGLDAQPYRYLAADRTSLDIEAMLDDLKNKARPGDAVLLHGCCHNPTGIDPTADEWKEIAKVVAEKSLIPMLDFAYQGFGAGLSQDAVGLRTVLNSVDEAIVCSSFSKNFGLYSERVGAMSIVASDANACQASLSQLKRIVRTNYSNPPRHGGAIVATVLDDAALTAMWTEELTEMRERITRLRNDFIDTMKTTGAGHDFEFLRSQNGMFSFSGLTPLQVDELKNKHSIYIVGSGRINVAGISESKLEQLCTAVASVIES